MREIGFYWIKYCNKWLVGQWDGCLWWLPGTSEFIESKELDAIKEDQIKFTTV